MALSIRFVIGIVGMKIEEFIVTPIALSDPPLRNAAGLHAPYALRIILEIVTDTGLSGVGEIPGSGWRLRDEYARYDAERRFALGGIAADEPDECIAGEVLQGHRKPFDCPAFGIRCTPESPLGAPMVSAEGACAAYHRYRRRQAGGR